MGGISVRSLGQMVVSTILGMIKRFASGGCARRGNMKSFYAVALCTAMTLSASLAGAQVASSSTNAGPIVAVARDAPVGGDTYLRSNTEVWLSVNQEVNSKKLKVGQKFPLSVSRDVMIRDFVVIPRGTPAEGQITYRTGKGAFGKSAKIEFDLVDIDLKGRLIPTSGHYRIEGQGNTGATVGVVVAAGVFGAFVTGHSAVVQQGAEFRAYTKEQMSVILASAAAAGSAGVALAK